MKLLGLQFPWIFFLFFWQGQLGFDGFSTRLCTRCSLHGTAACHMCGVRYMALAKHRHQFGILEQGQQVRQLDGPAV